MRISCAQLLMCLSMTVLAFAGKALGSEPLIPGTGVKIDKVGDDFEDVNWKYYPNGPKSSKNLDERTRTPAGISANKRWYEGVKRGQPDVVKRVATPPGGPEGSTGAMLLRSIHTGIPGRPSYHMQQDDFIADVKYRLGGTIPVSQSPNVVVRVFLPPVDQWENRTGTHFGFRCAVETFRDREWETYWPGMFIAFESKDGSKREHDYAYLRIRGDKYGRDYKVKQITTTGWWTFGMSFTPDGRVHYYAKPGLEDLTAEDHLGTQYPYSYRCMRFKTFFFNVCSADNGHTWSTPWVIDNAELYIVRTATARNSSPRRR